MTARLDPAACARLLLADGIWYDVERVERTPAETWPLTGSDLSLVTVTFPDGRRVLLRDQAILGYEARDGAVLLVEPERTLVDGVNPLAAVGVSSTFFSTTDGSTTDVRSGVRRISSRPEA